MKKFKLFGIIYTLFVLLIFTISCGSDGSSARDTEENTSTVTSFNFTYQIPSYPTWDYFVSNKVEKLNTPSNPKTNTGWDLAVTIGADGKIVFKTNSGTSGAGKGGAVAIDGKTFDDVETAPTSGYSVDDESSKIKQIKDGNKKNVKISSNNVLNQWYDYSSKKIKDKVFVIKTATGKYTKIKITSYNSVQKKITGKLLLQNKEGSTDLK